jgi:predicted amidophosphoribosyltransferase
VLARLLDLLVPVSCLACSAPQGDTEDVLCEACHGALQWMDGPLCARCGLPEHPPRRRCPAPADGPSRSWAPLAHAGPAATLVHALKHRGILRAAAPMAAVIAVNAPLDLFAAGAALVPVPADPLRRRRRGHDHALRLACELGELVDLPVHACLRRPRAVRSQVGASRARRLAAPIDVVAAGPLPRERRIVLVDDVQTTGATLAACARAIARAADGAAEPNIAAVTYVRALSAS